ncbi:MAG: Smr/MutS family protein [Victivallaceae bacterium]
MNFHYDIQIDFHGCTTIEVIPRLEELFFAESSQSIMIIHGKGSGVLKKAVRDYVAGCTCIKGYDWGENLNIPGADGITIVYT